MIFIHNNFIVTFDSASTSYIEHPDRISDSLVERAGNLIRLSVLVFINAQDVNTLT